MPVLAFYPPSPKPAICKQCVIQIVGEKSLRICVSGDVRVCWFQADKKEEPRPGMTAVGQLVGGAAHPISHFIRCRNLPLPITLVITDTAMARSGSAALPAGLAPSSRYDAGSSEQVFCTWLIREWNFAYLHHIHTRESPSEYSEGRYWSTLMYVVLKFLSYLQFQYKTTSIRNLLVRWCRMSVHY